MTPPPAGPEGRGFRGDRAAILLVVLGLAARVLAARHSFVSPDEDMHVRIAGSGSLGEVYRLSLTNAHPPLFLLILHGWQQIVGLTWQLCLLPVAFGTAFLWVAYRWARMLFGAIPALTALALLAFLPTVVLLSAELRSYSMALFLVAIGLAALESGLREESPGRIALAAGSMALALGTHYLALRPAFAALAYGALRIVASRPPRPVVRAFAASQAALAALFLFFYRSHLSKLRGGGMERDAQSDWLRASYLQAEDGPLPFVLRQTAALFRYLFSSPSAGLLAGALTLAGVVILARERRPAALLLALPFVLAAAGSLLRLYPYGGSRHSVDLALFASTAIGISVARAAGDRPLVPLLLAAALAPAAFAATW